jgi:tetratricopeptide (TPR) repeat protein
VRLNPRNFPAQYDLIEFYVQAPGIVGGGEDKARRQVEALAALDEAEGHVARGKYWMNRKKPELAEQEYRQVLAAQPHRASPYLGVAEFYMQRKDAAKMEEALEAARRIEPSNRELSYFCGVVRVLAGNRLDEAEQCLKTYLATTPPRSDLPSNGDAQEWLGWLYEREGKCQQALEQYRQAIQLDPRSKSPREAARRLQHCPSGQ